VIWRISARTHCKLVALISNAMPIDISLKQRFCKFSEKLFTRGSKFIKCIANIALNNLISDFCINYNAVIGHGNCVLQACHRALRNVWTDSASDDKHLKVHVIKVLVEIHAGRAQCSILSPDEIRSMLEDLCIN